MARVIFKDLNHEISVQPGTPLIDVLREAAPGFALPCGGEGHCGKCRVMVKGEANEPTAVETEFLSAAELAAGVRLACQVRVEGELEVKLPAEAQTAEKVAIKLDAAWQKLFHIVPGQGFAVAVDLGTTTLAAYLIDRETPAIRATVSGANPQNAYGADLINRISYASTPEGLEKLRTVLVEAVNGLLGRLCEGAGLSRQAIGRVHLAGNTVMLHLYRGTDPAPLGVAPYQAVFTEMVRLFPEEAGLEMASDGVVVLLPGIGGFVGADILAGLYACKASVAQTALFIDIGTNGEVVLSGNGRMLAASTAAGPAFEGAGIACGMSAGPGAIINLAMPEGRPVVEIIGGAPARGICGTGLVRIISELRKADIIGEDGAFTSLAQGEFFDAAAKSFRLTSEVFLSQADIRQFQLAKGAIRAGVELLLNKMALRTADLETVYLAGAFGNYLRPEDALYLGLLPSLPIERIRAVGNAAGLGAALSLLVPEALDEMASLAQQINHVELAEEPGFGEAFVEAMSLSGE
jgi:uncharacterized 2Fe-2S/4Fe-4S cluster protein (DUF4445 family)